MNANFKNNRKYEKNEQRLGDRRNPPRRRRRLEHALDFFLADQPIKFFINLIYR